MNICPSSLLAAASFDIVLALKQAAEKLGYPHPCRRDPVQGQLLRRDPPGTDADRGRAHRKMEGLEGCGRAHERDGVRGACDRRTGAPGPLRAVLNVLWNADNDDAPAIPAGCSRTRRAAVEAIRILNWEDRAKA